MHLLIRTVVAFGLLLLYLILAGALPIHGVISLIGLAVWIFVISRIDSAIRERLRP